MITLTDSAEEQINTLCKDNKCYGVSLNVKGGGCAGFEYDWQLVESPLAIDENDIVIKTAQGCAFIVGVHSQMFLIGTEINYKKDVMGSMFEVNNPNAQSACGCGVSVNFDGMF